MLANTLYPQNNSSKATCHLPIILTHNQIDYILTTQWFKSNIYKYKLPGVDINSDNDSFCNINIRTLQNSKNSRVVFDEEK